MLKEITEVALESQVLNSLKSLVKWEALTKYSEEVIDAEGVTRLG